MRFVFHKPPSPLDLRNQVFTSLEALNAIAPALRVEADGEQHAVTMAHGMYPDGIGMPVVINVGSGKLWVMAFVDDASDRDLSTDDNIPFVMFVRAVAETPRDKLSISRFAHFDQRKWRPPVQRPLATTSVVHPVEVRATDLAMPMHVNAVIGKLADGSSVIAFEVGSVSMSIRFANASELHIGRSDPARTMPADVGASYDPNPR